MDCEHGSDPMCCAVCGPAAADRRQPPEVGPPFEAGWPGWCPECKTTIDPGDLCRMVDGYAWCATCADDLAGGR